MSKILRNDNPTQAVDLLDTGVSIGPTTSYTIPPQDYPTFAASSDVIRALSIGQLTLNDGGNDITNLSNAIDIIKGWFPGQASDVDDFFFDYFDVPIGAGPHILFSHNVAFPDVLELGRLTVSCRFESMFKVLKNGAVIADLRTGPSKPTALFTWYPFREIGIGDLIEIIFQKRIGAPDVSVGLNFQGITKKLTE